jgi:ATP-dependent helicase HrpB
MVNLREGDSLARSSWIVAAHLDAGAVKAGGIQEGRVYLGAPVHFDDLKHQITETESVLWDDSRETVVTVKERRLGNLLVQSQPVQTAAMELQLKVLLSVIREKGFRFLEWDEKIVHLMNRLQSVHFWRKGESWPDVSEATLLESLETWLAPFLDGVRSAAQLRKLDWESILLSIIPWPLQQQLDQLAPKDMPVPSGSRILLHYFEDGKAPIMEVRLQELFGMAETPRVNEGQIPVMLHLLSPGYKPVQVTQDLKSFWNTTYFEVKKELRMRYPKHSWPDDPWTAEAVRGVKRRDR